MKTKTTLVLTTFLALNFIALERQAYGQNAKVADYLSSGKLFTNLKFDETSPKKYRFVADYLNYNIYCDFMNKVEVYGEYSRNMKKNTVKWNNVSLANANQKNAPYPKGIKQEYMENFEYTPSSDFLKESSFSNFPKSLENIFVRNLIWDLMAIEEFSWNYLDSLQLNKSYKLPNKSESFAMADIGKYQHSNIFLCWVGVSLVNNELCAVIEYRAFDNKLEINSGEMKSKGIELYWGKTWVSLKDKDIELADMYSNTSQEMEMSNVPNKFTICTTREIKIDRIK